MNDRTLRPGWLRADLGSVTREEKVRVGIRPAPVVLSSTKHHGLVPSDEFFKNRTIYSADLSNYKSVKMNWFAYATNHLAEGSIGLQERFTDSCVSPIYTVFSCREWIDPRFLFRVLKSPAALAAFQLHEQASVDRRGAVRYRDFAKVEFDLPPIDEQRRIAEVLDTVDSAILLTERVIEKLGKIRGGLLRDLLTRGIDDQGQPRDPLGRPEDFINTELGAIPATWEIRSFGELAKYLNGYAFKPEDWQEAGRPIIRIQNINGSDSFNHYEGSVPSHCEIRPGDLIFAWSGTRDSSFGPTIWQGPEGLLNQHIFHVYENLELVSRGFLHSLLAHSLERIAASAHGFKASFVHVKRGELTSVKVAVPGKAEQERILLAIQDHDNVSNNEIQLLRSLRQIKKGLLDDLLTGRVLVPNASEEVA